MTEFHVNAILPIASYSAGVSFLIQVAYRLKATPFTGEVCETDRSLVRMESCWKTRGTVCHTVRVLSYQYSTWYLSVCASGLCVGVCQAMALISNATSEVKVVWLKPD